MNLSLVFLIAFLCAGIFFSVYTRRLTLTAALCGGLIAYILFKASGYAGVSVMTAFFVLGTWATGWKHQLKEQRGLATGQKEQRVAWQVLANAGAPGIIALAACIWPVHQELCLVLIASAFASAASDTMSSELGNVYGRRFYHILTLRRDVRGENGVVSLEGSLAGLAGSAAIALVYILFQGWAPTVLVVLIAGMVGNLFDSVLGASLERKHLINNDAVNFLNTTFAAAFAGLIIWMANLQA